MTRDAMLALLRGDPLDDAGRDRLLERLVARELDEETVRVDRRRMEALQAIAVRALLADRRLLAWALVDHFDRPPRSAGELLEELVGTLERRRRAA